MLRWFCVQFSVVCSPSTKGISHNGLQKEQGHYFSLINSYPNRTISTTRKILTPAMCTLQAQSQPHVVTRSISSRREKATLPNPISLFLLDIVSLSPSFISPAQCAVNLFRFIHSFHFGSMSLWGQSIEDEMEIILHY